MAQLYSLFDGLRLKNRCYFKASVPYGGVSWWNSWVQTYPLLELPGAYTSF